MRRIGTLVVLAAAVLAWPITAATPTAKPEDVGFSSERLHRINDLVQRHITAGSFSGAVTLVARNGRIAHFEAQGLMDIEAAEADAEGRHLQDHVDDQARVGVSIMMMIEEGKVRLTDPVSKFIPELKDLKVAVPMAARAWAPPAGGRGAAPAEPRYYTVPAEREITIRDLLTHTSGLVSGGLSGTEARKVALKGKESLADYIPRLGGVPLDFQPGSRWAYSAQAGFDMLARVVEVVSGMPFDQFTKTRIFDPLGMKDTFFYPADGNPRMVDAVRAWAERTTREAGPGELLQRGVLLGRRRSDEHGGGLSAVRADAAQRRTTERQGPSQPAHGGDDGLGPRTRHAAGPSARRRLRPEHARRERSGRRATRSCRRAASGGAARTARTSGSIRRKRLSPC